MGQKRLKVFTEVERKDLYSPPEFTSEERKHYFSLSPMELEIVSELRTSKSKVFFILLLGYFKAKRRFFSGCDLQNEDDIAFISKEYLGGASIQDHSIPDSTRKWHQSTILKLTGYRVCNAKITEELKQRAERLASISIDPIYIIRGLLSFLTDKKIVIPSASSLQDMVGKTSTQERRRIELVVNQLLSKSDKDLLKQLLESEDETGIHTLTGLKKDPVDFSYSQTSKEIKRKILLESLYNQANKIIQSTGISNETIKHFALLVDFYTVYKLKRMNKLTAQLYLVCFVVTRYRKINDNLVTAFIYLADNYWQEAKQAAKEKVYDLKVDSNENLFLAAGVLELFTDKGLDSQTSLQEIRKKAFKILPRRKFDATIQFMKDGLFDEEAMRWLHIGKIGSKIARNMRPLFRNIVFSAHGDSPDILIESIEKLRVLLNKNGVKLQKQIRQVVDPLVPKKLRPHVIGSSTEEGLEFNERQIQNWLISKAEFFLYHQICKALAADNVFAPNTFQYLSFENDLIDKEIWSKEKVELLKRCELKGMDNPKTVLAEIKNELDDAYQSINNRINSGENSSYKETPRRKNPWTLEYPKIDKSTESTKFFSKTDQVGIYDVMQFVDHECSFVNAFTHVLKNRPGTLKETSVVLACIIAYGTNFGLHRMAAISDLGFAALSTTSKGFIRLETLKEANDIVVNKIASLPMFDFYNRNEGIIHSSSDGQKLETVSPTIKSRFAPKYFGLKKGKVGYTLVANHIPVNARMISGNEHESHYVSDLLINNTSEVQPKIHSTDTHGVNNVNFLILNALGYQFAPRYKNFVGRAMTSLVAFGDLRRFKNKQIRPLNRVDESLIEEEWDNIQRFLVSVSLRETTQSTIVRKLSSYNNKNKTKKAIWSLDGVYESLHMLKYIDDPSYRQAIQGSLNRGESYHSLRRGVAIANREIAAKGDVEQEIWNECARLLANVIEYYNMTLLSKVLEEGQKQGQSDVVDKLKRVSLASWQHINLYGRYAFKDDQPGIDVGKIAKSLVTQVLSV